MDTNFGPRNESQQFNENLKQTLDPTRHRFQTNAALYSASFTVVVFGILNLLFAEQHRGGEELASISIDIDHFDHTDHRVLEERDYSSYSCHNLYNETPYRGEAQCAFARTCNDGAGVWAPSVFCWNSFISTAWLCALISPFIILWLVILFRVLGSTAEDYFSPSLEMFSVKMGLPPRFAGVSLLALGNGAADVSATVNAITSDKESGYLLSLGALTGAAMFVGGVVAAIVVIVAGGVHCRGALVRDVLALFITVLIVWAHLSSGTVGPEAISLFVSLYGIFVVLVLVADVYHRRVVVPRLQQRAQDSERARQLDEERNAQEVAGDALNDLADQTTDNTDSPCSKNTAGSKALSTVLGALSNYESDPTTQQEGWGVDADDLGQDRPVLLHGTHGILRGDGAVGVNSTGDEEVKTDSPYAILEDDADRICADPNFLGVSAGSWKAAWHDGKEELRAHANEMWEDIAYNGDVHPLDKFLLICELPLTILRKITVAIPCEGYYCRALVAVSLALSPIWLAYYLATEHEVKILALDAMFFLFVLLLVTVSLGAFVLRYAPGGDGVMALGVSAPIALYGFIIAATWIDAVADHLVQVLDFLGIVLRIPGPIIGLTILAWGNSVADLSANVAMARKGLANMAMTACFAGPVFNILIGLGLGFSSLSAKTGELESQVTLTPPVLTGFVFILLNTACMLVTGIFLGKGTITKEYGYVALGLYSIYVVSSIGLEYSKFGDGK